MLYLKDKLNDVLRETKIINKEIKSISDETSMEINPGWMKDVTFNVVTCNSDIQEYIDSRKDEPPSDNRSIRPRINVAIAKMAKVTLRSNEMRTNMWNMYKKACLI